MLHYFVTGDKSSILYALGMLIAFLATLLATRAAQEKLPCDMGREFAVNGALSKGKPRGAGLVFVLVYVVCTLLFVPLSAELICYLALVALAMLTGFLDDASRAPWGEYRKGLLDLIVAIFTAVVYLYYNGSQLYFAIAGVSIVLPYWLYGLLTVILVWASINVTNCTDGVDGLSATLTTITLLSIYGASRVIGSGTETLQSLLFFVMVLAGYLWYNASPSKLLMGDAGSRAMGLFIAIAVLQTGAPLLYLLFAAVLMIDGGIGLVKVSLKRFLKISILRNTITPLHDHVRKHKGWSDTQVVLRFAVIQFALSACVCMLLNRC